MGATAGHDTEDEGNMDSLITDLASIVGAEHVLPGDAVSTRRQDTAPYERQPLAVVSPATTAELQSVLALARRHDLTVWPNGQGRNWGYGAAVPLVERSIVLLLRRMNRIHHVDRELAFAVIEPGVTYRQLNQYVTEHAPDLWIDTIDGTPNGSVLGNALERGVGPTPYGDHYAQLCGLQVLLPNGELIETGGMDSAATFHTYRWGAGPVVDGLFSQSNLGIVVKAGIWLMPRPEKFCSFLFESREDADVVDIVDAFRRLFLTGVLRGAIRMINEMVSISLVAQYPLGPGQCLAEAEITALRERYGISKWTLSAGLYGTADSLSAQKKRLKSALKHLGKLEFLDDRKVALASRYVALTKTFEPRSTVRRVLEALPKRMLNKPIEVIEAVPHVHGLMKGIPTEFFVRHAYFKMQSRPESDVEPARDGCGVIWFAPIVPNRSADIVRAMDIGRACYQQAGFEFHVALIFQNPRSAIVLMSIFYFRDVESERQRAQRLEIELARQCRAAGYHEYRTGLSNMGIPHTQNPAYASFLKRLKDAVDPDGILSPGRYGIGVDPPT